MIQVGEKYETNNCGGLTIVRYVNNHDVLVRFDATGTVVRTRSKHIRSGAVKDCFHPTVLGIGYIGYGAHKASCNSAPTKFYALWRTMLARCYCPERLSTMQSYKDCTVCAEWRNFQNFADWLTENYVEGLQIDKDILVKGNRVYSPDTCKFVTSAENAIEASAKHYTLTSPRGESIDIYNLSAFCRKNHLNPSCMAKVHAGKQAHHKGWTKAIST